MQSIPTFFLVLTIALAVAAQDVGDRTVSPAVLLCVKGSQLGFKMALALAACIGTLPSTLLPAGKLTTSPCPSYDQLMAQYQVSSYIVILIIDK
jgi:hypothetical protein